MAHREASELGRHTGVVPSNCYTVGINIHAFCIDDKPWQRG